MATFDLDQTDAADHDARALERFLDDLWGYVRESRRALEPDLPRIHAQAIQSVRQPLRLTLLNALADLGHPTPTPTLKAFIAARVGRDIPSSQFGTLAGQERRAFDRGGLDARPVWLCSGISADHFRPIKRIWARSDWPLEARIIAPTTSRVQHLQLTEDLCRLALAADREAQDPAALRELALTYAEDLPGVSADRVAPDFRRYAEVAQQLLKQYRGEDLRLRHRAAKGLSTMPVRVQLFGREDDRPATAPDVGLDP